MGQSPFLWVRLWQGSAFIAPNPHPRGMGMPFGLSEPDVALWASNLFEHSVKAERDGPPVSYKGQKPAPQNREFERALELLVTFNSEMPFLSQEGQERAVKPSMD